jgi:hypothetical protein
MAKDSRNLLRVLQSERIFLDAGGYSAWAGARWRLPLVFEESPTCPNYNDSSHSIGCKDCCLMPLVPLRHQNQEVPCRHIPLSDVGETLDTLYRWGTMDDLTRVFRRWLLHTIEQLERKQRRRQWIRDRSVYRAAEFT